MLVIVGRSGPPEAMNLPVAFCDECDTPIERYGNAVWYEYWNDDNNEVERSPISFVHKHCAERFESHHVKTCPEAGRGICLAHYRWYELSEFLAHLAHNLKHPISEDPGLEDGSVSYRTPKLRLEGRRA